MALLIHILCAFLWLGCVLVEIVLERAGPESALLRRWLALAHWRLDLCVELPAFLGVLATGGYLAGILPVTPLLTTNIAAGLIAIGASVYGVLAVGRRLSANSAGDLIRKSALDRTQHRYGAVASVAVLIVVAMGAHLVSG